MIANVVAKRGCIGGALLALALLVAGAGPAACNPDGVACAAGDFDHCACPASAPVTRGYQQCLDDGSRYGACDCSGTIPAGAGVLVEAGADADAEAGDAAPDSGKLPFLASCSTSAMCASNLCFPFNAYGPHCSTPCTKDIDCPAPSPGCSKMGACKLH